MRTLFNSLKNNFKSYFTPGHDGRRRLITFLCVLLFLLFFSSKIFLFFKGDSEPDITSFNKEVAEYYAQRKNVKEKNNFSEVHVNEESSEPSELVNSAQTDVSLLFQFDPNTATETDFQKLGLKPNVVKSILNYRAKGGKFFSTADFKKIYTLDENDFNRLKDYIVIPNHSFGEKKKFDSQKPINPIYLDINSADSIQWIQLKGIGSFLASKIIKYRNALGGFYSVSQISEVYGMKPETFDSIKSFLNLSPNYTIKKININTADFDQLNAHPYINSKQAKIIISYRLQHGAYSSIDELKKTDSFTSAEIEKLKTYISFNN